MKDDAVPFFALADMREQYEPCEACGKPVGFGGRAFPIGGGWAYACPACVKRSEDEHSGNGAAQ